MYKKLHFTAVLLFITTAFSYAQTTFTWNSYPGAATSWTNGNLSIAFTGSGNYTDGAPKFGNPQGCAMGNGLYVAQDWNNSTSSTTMTITFATAVGAPVTFSISDINSNYCNSSTPYECTFLDEVTLTATDVASAGILPTVSGLCSGQTSTTAGNNRIIRADINTGGNGGCTCATTNFSVGTAGQCVKTITITYRNNQSSNAIWNNNPAYQYIILSAISTSAAPAATPPSSITGTTTICSSASTTLTAVGGNASSQWYTGSCGGTLIGTGASITVTPSTTTTYYVGNMSCGTLTSCASTTVTVNPAPTTPTISASGPTTFCAGGSVTLTSSSATGNTWSTGATTQSITVSAAGTYTVNYLSGGCNSANGSATITVNPLPATPTISASGPLTFCAGGSVTLTSSSATGNTWSTGATTQSITVSAAGTYSVNVTNGNGCVSANASRTIVVNPLPTAPTISTSGPTTFCTGGSVTLTSSSATGNTWSTGATTQSITVSAAGTYTVSYLSGGCNSPSASSTITVNPLPTTPTVSASGPLTFCSGGSVTLTSSSATGNTWSTGATTQSITVNSSGTYTVNVTNGNGCISANGSSTITVNPLPATPTISAGGPLTFCAGNTVTLTSSSASGNTWSTGATTQSITVNASGTYSVTVGSAGCNATSANTAVTVNPLPSTPVLSASGPTTFCSGGNVVLTSSSASGNTWSTGATTQSITVSTSGTYTVSVTDGNGCTSSTASSTITVNPLPATPTVAASGPLTFCAGGSITLTSSSASGNTWNTGATTQSITVNASGAYSVTVGAAGCNATSANTTVTVNTLPSTPVLSASGPTTFCAGNSITLTSSSVTGNTWSTGATTQSITVSTSGTYTVSVTDGNGCTSSTASSTITVNPLPATPTVAASGPTTFCAGGSITLTSSSASGNTWSTGATTQSITVNASGTYSVTVSSTGCTATSANTTVTVNPLPSTPVVAASGPTTFCSGNNITLTSSSATGNTWSTGATTQSITVSAAGTYTVSVTDGNGCTSSTASTTITVNPLPSAPTISASGPTTFCTGGSVTLTSSSASGNTWSTGATTQSITVSTSGTYSVNFVDGNGCTSASASTTVTEVSNPPVPTVSAGGPLTFCAGGNVVLTSSSASGNTWSTGATTQSITVSAAGNYSVTVGAAGCSSNSANTTVVINPLPSTPVVATSGPTTFCIGGTVTLTSSSTTGNTWSTGATSQSITVSTSGAYTVSVTDGNGCTSSTASTTITVNPLPSTPTVSASGPLTFCTGGSVVLTSSSATGNTWSTGATTQNITATTSGTYTVGITDGNGCSSANGSVTIVVNSNPTTPTVSASGPLTFCAGDNVTLTSSSATGNVWSDGSTTQSITVNAAGTYSVTVSDINSCSASSANTTIVVNVTPATPTITDSGLNICAGQTTTLTSSSATGNTWSTGETTQTITVNASGTYTLITNNGSCNSLPTSAIVTVNSNPATPTISTSGPLTFCQGDSVTLTSSSVNGNTWSTGETTQSIVVSSSGTYDVTVGAAGCSAISSSTSTVELPLPSTPSISNTGLAFCAGQSTTLTSTNATGNNWSTGETTNTINVTTGGNYWLTSTDGNGCVSDTAFVAVTVNSLPNAPVIAAGSPLTFCQGDSVTLTASPGTGIVWSPNNSTDSVLTTNTSGNYSVVYTDANGCTNTSAVVTVVVNTIPSSPSLSVSGGSNAICQGQTATLTANPNTGISWSPGGQTTGTIAVNTAGTYYASFTDANGCTSPLDSILITVNPNPIIASTINIDSAFCNTNTGGINNVIVTGGTGTYSYQWFNNATPVGTDSILANVNSGNYTLIVTDQSGCTDTSNVMSVPSAGGISVSLTANPTSGMEPFNTDVLATTTTAANSYTWFLNNSLIPSETDSINNLTNLNQGSYTTSVIVTDSYGCADTASITIVVDGNIDLVIPNVFSPNGDNTNDVFFITAEGYKQLHLEIYDRWGLKLWEVEGLNPSWDGRTSAGLVVPDGTYYYILTGTDFRDKAMEKTGYLSVVK
jgi:gliding motility-associated-like protein